MSKLSVKVNAKINLNLFITGNRGRMHTLDSVMHSIDLYDVVTMSTHGAGVYMDGVEDEGNCLHKVLNKMREYDLPEVRFDIQKGIPVEAGLGGSSADIAGAIVLVREVFGVDLPASEFGSDVAFMVSGGMARVSGTGDEIELHEPCSLNLVIAKGIGGISTKACYDEFDRIGKGTISTSGELIKALHGSDFEKLPTLIVNDLIYPATTLEPDIKRVYDEVKKTTPMVSMSGSGNAVFGIYEDEESAKRAVELLKDKVEYVKNLKTLSTGVEII